MAKKKAKKKRSKKLDTPTIAALCVQNFVEGKDRYSKADAALTVLEGRLKPGDVVKLPNHEWIDEDLRGRSYRFNDKGSLFPVGQKARRFELRQV